MLRFWIALSLALIATTAASAGPIAWSYSSAVTPAPTAGSMYQYFVVSGATVHTLTLSQPAGVAERAAWGWQTVTVAEFTPTMYANPNDPVPDYARLALTITDAASGQAGTITATVRPAETLTFAQERQWDGTVADNDQWIIGRHVTGFALEQLSDDSLTLGGNEYRVQLEQRFGADGRGFLEAAVTVGDVNLTPEPSTLVAAGVGLLGVGLRRRLASRAP